MYNTLQAPGYARLEMILKNLLGLHMLLFVKFKHATADNFHVSVRSTKPVISSENFSKTMSVKARADTT